MMSKWGLILIRITANILIGFLYFCNPGNAQPPDTLWSKLYGGPGNDYGYWLDLTSDGGFVITGSYSQGTGNTDIYLIKTGEDGDTLWTAVFGGDFYDVGRWICQTSDNGYIVVGTESRINNTERNICILKTDSLGTVLWNHSYGGDQEDGAVTARSTSDGGYIIIGYTASFGLGYMDAWLLKIDADGDTTWTKTFGGGDYDSGRSVIQTPDGGYFVLCNINYGFNDTGLTLIKTDAYGNTLWTRRYCQNYATGVSIISTVDGGYMILANTLGFSDDFDMQLIKINESGDSLWTRIIGDVDIDMGYSLRQTADGGYLLCGITGPYFDQDIYVVKTDGNGDTLWSLTFNGAPYGNDLGSFARPTADGGVILTGSLSTGDAMQEVCLIRIESEQVKVEESINDRQPSRISFLFNYPNPFNSSTVIEFTLPDARFVTLAVYDLRGCMVRELLNEFVRGGIHEVNFDAPSLSSGVYFYRLRTGEATVTRKMLLIK